MRKSFFLLCMLSLYALGTNAQRTVHNQYLYWIRYQNQTAFANRWFLANDIENRRFVRPDVENMVITNTRIHYRPKPWDMAAGMTLTWVYARQPELGYSNVDHEIRPYLEGSHETKLNKFSMSNRIRYEFRFMQSVPEQRIWDQSDFNMRARYRLLFQRPLKSNSDGVATIKGRMAHEIILNVYGDLFNQYQFHLNTEFRLNSHTAVETGYVYFYQKTNGAPEYFSRHIFRFTLTHTLSLLKKT